MAADRLTRLGVERPARRGTGGRRKAGDVPPIVLAVLQAVWRETATRRPPSYVSVDSLGLTHDPEPSDAAILLAVLAGYLTAGGNPPHSVAITEEGRRLLKERGMA